MLLHSFFKSWHGMFGSLYSLVKIMRIYTDSQGSIWFLNNHSWVHPLVGWVIFLMASMFSIQSSSSLNLDWRIKENRLVSWIDGFAPFISNILFSTFSFPTLSKRSESVVNILSVPSLPGWRLSISFTRFSWWLALKPKIGVPGWLIVFQTFGCNSAYRTHS